jgi:hypothetical protein
MTFDFNAAKQAGYTDEEIKSFLDKRPELRAQKFDLQKAVKESNPTKAEREEKAKLDFDVEGALKAGYSQQEINQFLKKASTTRGASLIGAPIKGLVKGLHDVDRLTDVIGWFGESPSSKAREEAEALLEEHLPTKEKTAEQFLERGARLAPSAALFGGAAVPAALSVGGGAIGGQLAQEMGAGTTGQAIGEILGSIGPGLIKGAVKKGTALVKAPKETLPSGLTKPRAVEAAAPKLASITKAKQEKTIEALNKEASHLAKEAIHKELPIAKGIEEGFDFESKFEKEFGELRRIAQKHNAAIEIEPIEKLFEETASKYRGIPKLHKEAERIEKEIIAFNRNPQEGLSELVKIYRSNNKKMKQIYETSRLTGSQEEFVDFLVDYNRAIAKSIENTLPADSAWLKAFKGANAEFRNYKGAQKAIKLLEPILEEKLTAASLKKLANDSKTHGKLKLALGEKGSQSVIQVSKDLEQATKAIKNIPVKEIQTWDKILPLSILVPGFHVPGAVVSAKKGYDWVRRGYGWFLASPKRAKAYSDALKAISEGSKPAYAKAAETLKDLFHEED